MSNTPRPTELNYRQQAKVMTVSFDTGEQFELTAEFLRVYSPSAEVRGHGPGQEVLQIGKESVGIDQIVPVGQYAVCLHFDDGHDTGIYSWEELLWLGQNQSQLWEDYLSRLKAANHARRAT